MKLLSIFTLMTGAVIFAQNHNNDWELAQLQGKVKIGGQKEFKVDENGQPSEIENDFKAYFNKQGFITQMEHKGPEGIQIFKIEFNKEGYPIKNESFNPQGKLISTTIRKNNSLGKILSSQTFDYQGNSQFKDTYQYNEQGLCTEKQVCYTTHCFLKETYIYNDKNEIIRIKYYDGDNNLTQIVENQYDDKGNKIEARELSPSNNLMYHYVFSYDKWQNQTQKITYDNQGKIIEQHQISYQYDKNGNWTRKEESVDGKLIKVTEQFVEYY